MTRTQIPIMDCRRQYQTLQSEIDAALSRVSGRGVYLHGPETQAFEQEFAEYCGVRHAAAVANGTDALELSLRALGCGPGAEVITVANAGMYASAATVLVGAVPIYVDVEPETLLMSLTSLERMVSERTRAVVVTHLYGRLCDVAAIRRVLGSREIAIVEDCAQAHGARSDKGVAAGSLGDLAAFSFYPTKNLGAFGDGGAVLTNSDALAERVRALSQYGWSDRFHAVLPKGRNSRLDELQAAVLRVKLSRLDRWNARRREIADRYREAARESAFSIVSAGSAAGTADVVHLCVARHPNRDAIRAQWQAEGIGTGIHYPLLDTEQAALRDVAWHADALEAAVAAQAQILSLPCFPEMTTREVDRVCDQLRNSSGAESTGSMQRS